MWCAFLRMCLCVREAQRAMEDDFTAAARQAATAADEAVTAVVDRASAAFAAEAAHLRLTLQDMQAAVSEAGGGGAPAPKLPATHDQSRRASSFAETARASLHRWEREERGSSVARSVSPPRAGDRSGRRVHIVDGEDDDDASTRLVAQGAAELQSHLRALAVSLSHLDGAHGGDGAGPRHTTTRGRSLHRGAGEDLRARSRSSSSKSHSAEVLRRVHGGRGSSSSSGEDSGRGSDSGARAAPSQRPAGSLGDHVASEHLRQHVARLVAAVRGHLDALSSAYDEMAHRARAASRRAAITKADAVAAARRGVDAAAVNALLSGVGTLGTVSAPLGRAPASLDMPSGVQEVSGSWSAPPRTATAPLPVHSPRASVLGDVDPSTGRSNAAVAPPLPASSHSDDVSAPWASLLRGDAAAPVPDASPPHTQPAWLSLSETHQAARVPSLNGRVGAPQPAVRHGLAIPGGRPVDTATAFAGSRTAVNASASSAMSSFVTPSGHSAPVAALLDGRTSGVTWPSTSPVTPNAARADARSRPPPPAATTDWTTQARGHGGGSAGAWLLDASAITRRSSLDTGSGVGWAGERVTAPATTSARGSGSGVGAGELVGLQRELAQFQAANRDLIRRLTGRGGGGKMVGLSKLSAPFREMLKRLRAILRPQLRQRISCCCCSPRSRRLAAWPAARHPVPVSAVGGAGTAARSTTLRNAARCSRGGTERPPPHQPHSASPTHAG